MQCRLLNNIVDFCYVFLQHVSDKYLQYAHEYADGALKVGDDLCERMQQLTPEEFEGVLRPAYQADEWKLIVVGAVLGMIAGFMQLYIV